MLETEKILQAKISSRIIRREVKHNEKIDKLLSEICLAFKVEKPKLLFCDTLTRRISSFEYRKIQYIIFDNSLFEFLFLFDKLLLSNAIIADIDKLYYKILYEECLFQNVTLALSCYQKYKSQLFSFDSLYDDEANVYIACQTNFLLLHEVVHFDIAKNKNRDDYLNFKKMAFQCFFHLANKYSCGSYIKEGLFEHFGLNIDIAKDELEYSFVFKKLEPFLEECFCDFKAFEYICKTYNKHSVLVSSSYSLLHFLINSEMIRNSFSSHAITLNASVDKPFFASYLRMHLFTLIVYFSKLDIEEKLLENCQKIDSRYAVVLEDVNNLPKIAINGALKAMLIKMSHEYILGDD